MRVHIWARKGATVSMLTSLCSSSLLAVDWGSKGELSQIVQTFVRLAVGQCQDLFAGQVHESWTLSLSHDSFSVPKDLAWTQKTTSSVGQCVDSQIGDSVLSVD
jgi:hypothetical protein